jgi:hypothetical protein
VTPSCSGCLFCVCRSAVFERHGKPQCDDEALLHLRSFDSSNNDNYDANPEITQSIVHVCKKHT